MKKQDLVSRILAKRPDLTREEVEILIANKVKLSPLIDEEAAAYMVASELGVDLGEVELVTRLKIGNLVPGMRNVSLMGRVIFLYPLQTFARADGTFGKVVRGVIADETGTINIVLWDDKAELVEEGKVVQDQVVEVVRGYTRKGLYEATELHVNSGGDITILPADVETIPRAEAFFKKIGQLTDRDRVVNVLGAVDKVFPIMEFGDERRRGRVLRTRIYDETGKVMVVFWDEWADRMKKVEKGECLRIVGGKIKKGRLGIEVHVDKMTSISVLKREIRKPLVRIGSLKEGMYGVDILAKVVDVRVGKVKTREGKVLRLARLLVGDQSGIAPMLFWEKHSELASSVRKGDVILSENCRVRDNRGILELVFTDDSSLVVNPDMPEVVALSQASITTAIGDLKKGLLGTIEGILIDSPRVQEVLTESGKPIKVATLKVTDGTGEIEVSLWRELVDKVRMLKEGDKIRMCCLRIIEERGKLKAVSSRWTHVESPSK